MKQTDVSGLAEAGFDSGIGSPSALFGVGFVGMLSRIHGDPVAV
jgi:hypothetical protein